ncbi:MAG: fibronectin type III domain-containing protein [Eubacterium sp.]|nr:fibronectin type III domain-containing protein [Eubacterium sp.]
MKTKRIISLMLAFLMMISVCAGMSFTANAAMADEAENYEMGTWYVGGTNGKASHRYFKIVINEKSYVSLDALTDANKMWFDIFDANGNNVMKDSDLGWKDNKTTEWREGHCGRFLSAGNYYLDIYFYAGNISFKFFVQAEKQIKMPKGKITSLKSSKAGKFTVKCDKATNAIGYRITYSTDERFKKNTKTVKSASVTKTISKLKKGKRYYVKVCPYTVYDDGTYVYGQNSLPKSVYVKK